MTSKTILILEGLQSSGKTILAEKLVETLQPKYRVRIFDEDETLTPIRNETRPEMWLRHYLQIVETIENSNEEIFILDRFHLTKWDLAIPYLYEPLEAGLAKHSSSLFLLTIPCNKIERRMRDTQAYRGPAWKLNSDGKSFTEEAERSCATQEILREYLQHSILPSREIGTDDKDWVGYVDEMLSFAHLKKSAQ